MLSKPSLLVFFFLAAVGFCAYYPGLRAGFVADDFVWLEKSRHLNEFNIFDTNSFAFAKGRPGALLIFSLLYWIFGLNSTGFHVVTLFFHVLNAFLIFLILKRFPMTRSFVFSVSLFFLVHCAHEESVFWAASLSSIFCLFFCLCAVLCYLEWLNGFQPVYKVLAIFFSVLAMSTREDGLMLPLYFSFIGFLFITDRTKGFSGYGRLFKRNFVFFVPALIFLLLRLSSAAKDPGPYAFTMNPFIWIKNLAYFVLHLTLPIRYFLDQLGYEWHNRLRHLFSSPIWLAGIGMAGLILFFLFWMIKKRKDVAIPNALKVGVVLTGIGLLPYLALDGNSPRFLYFSLVGGVYVLAHLIFLSTEWISKPATKGMARDILSAGIVLIGLAVLRERGHRWVKSGLVARSLIDETRMAVLKESSLARKIYVANLPFTQSGAYIFNPGNFEAALSLVAPEIVGRVQDIGIKSPEELRTYEDRRVLIFQDGRLVEWRAP